MNLCAEKGQPMAEIGKSVIGLTASVGRLWRAIDTWFQVLLHRTTRTERDWVAYVQQAPLVCAIPCIQGARMSHVLGAETSKPNQESKLYHLARQR